MEEKEEILEEVSTEEKSENIEIVEHTESKFDDLKPRTEMGKITEEEKKEILAEPVVEEKKEEIVETTEYKGIGAFGIIVTIIYILLTLVVLRLATLVLYVNVYDFDIKSTLLSILGVVVIAIPYIMLYKAGKKKDQKLSNNAIIYEIIVTILAASLFYFVLWPRIQSSISNQWCGINGCTRNE